MARRPEQHHPFRIQRVLHPEAAADIGARYAHALGRHTEHGVGQLRFQRVHAGAGELQVEAVFVVVGPDGAAWLQRRDHDAVVDQLQLDHVRRAGDCRLHRGSVALLEAI